MRFNMATNSSGAGDIVMDSAEFMSDEEEDFGTGVSSAGDTLFDVTVGHIEDIIMDDEFQTLQQDFMEKYYTEFEDTEENKFIYTDIHKEYISLIEKFLDDQIKERMDNFSMEDFQAQLIERKDELFGEVFEMLMTFSDFMAFKEMFVDYRADKEGTGIDLTDGFLVTSLGPDPFSVQSVGSKPSSASSTSSAPRVPPGGACSILTPLPSREPDMSRLLSSSSAVHAEEPMTMSPAQSQEESKQ